MDGDTFCSQGAEEGKEAQGTEHESSKSECSAQGSAPWLPVCLAEDETRQDKHLSSDAECRSHCQGECERTPEKKASRCTEGNECEGHAGPG
mmetsp:Transcript_11056/g.30919  ORF Transcript_11056/g.30919 Transcript_11056/m.30919 type:complete len:92 (+) Transcript_11056:640-915(+)